MKFTTSCHLKEAKELDQCLSRWAITVSRVESPSKNTKDNLSRWERSARIIPIARSCRMKCSLWTIDSHTSWSMLSRLCLIPGTKMAFGKSLEIRDEEATASWAGEWSSWPGATSRTPCGRRSGSNTPRGNSSQIGSRDKASASCVRWDTRSSSGASMRPASTPWSVQTEMIDRQYFTSLSADGPTSSFNWWSNAASLCRNLLHPRPSMVGTSTVSSCWVCRSASSGAKIDTCMRGQSNADQQKNRCRHAVAYSKKQWNINEVF